jgi:uncharacterized membrane protein
MIVYMFNISSRGSLKKSVLILFQFLSSPLDIPFYSARQNTSIFYTTNIIFFFQTSSKVPDKTELRDEKRDFMFTLITNITLKPQQKNSWKKDHM